MKMEITMKKCECCHLPNKSKVTAILTTQVFLVLGGEAAYRLNLFYDVPQSRICSRANCNANCSIKYGWISC